MSLMMLLSPCASLSKIQALLWSGFKGCLELHQIFHALDVTTTNRASVAADAFLPS